MARGNLAQIIADLSETVGNASPVNKLDMSDEKRTRLIQEVLADNLGPSFDVSVRHMGHYDRVLVGLVKRQGKFDRE